MKQDTGDKKTEWQNNFNNTHLVVESIETILFKSATLQPNPLLQKKKKY